MATRHSQFRPSQLARSLTLAGLATLLGAAPTLQAQDTQQQPPAQVQEEEIEVITVSGGFRGSLASALNQKRFETGSTDTIKAEDIADFPDLNLAESLQRIPGVAISRVAGEGRQISVRGLGPDFTRVRINGMEAQSTSGGTDAIGGANRGRGFDFNTFSSDLFSELTVRKTASANIEEGSLGATVDLRTARPFDYDGLTFAANVQAGYNDLSEEIDPKASFLVSNIFADGKFGALFSLAMSERNIVDNGASTVRWDNSNDFGSYLGDTSAPELTAINDGFRPRLPRYDSYTHNVKRTGAAAAFEFRPTQETRFNFDLLYSKDDSSRNEIFSQGILNNNAIAARMNVLDYEIDDSNTVTYAAFENATLRNENRYDELSTEFLQISLSAQHQLTDNIKIDGMIGRAKSEFDNPIQTTIVMEKTGVDFSYDYRGAKRQSPEIIYGASAYVADDWTINSVRLRPLGAENTFDNAAVNLEYVLNDNLTLHSGLHYKKFQFETREARLAKEGGLVGTNNLPMPTDLITTHNSGLGASNAWLIPNLNAFADAYGIYSNSGDFVVSTDNRRADNYSADEKTLGAYVQLAFETELGDTTIRGDVGGRYISTDQSSTAWASLGGTQTLVTAEHDYSDFLPSLNIVFEPLDDVLIRFGYAEVMARAGLGSIRPNVSVSVSGGSRSISGGNPTLEPTTAKTYDLGLELYFDNESLLGVAVFRKDIDSYVQGLRETKPFTETGLPIQAAIDACNAGPGYGAEFGCTENDEWQTNTPLNGPGGDLYGFEVQYQMPFTFLPEFWDRFGFIGNYTYVKAQLDYVNADGQLLATRDLQGLSENTRSATLYYEDDALSARVSLTDRSRYLTNAIGRNNNDMEGTNATRNIDASVSYQLTEQWKVSFEALNLTDEVDDQWVDSSGNRLTYYHETGRQYYIGAQYKF
ncbi:TonB-dependent receptor [Rheinheimera baltica]|uniref:TonB-dependent receptor n=1 Tax=Rheinheimera baltica TaxID=67576 RepID=A0ABT9I3P0_9GAMM|nr:TonB-dependent receptor [Rheinheimera baltica]MDP5137989.1 TonB-dependent receptor [Rheinheimera baltica]MDP5141904.1 TonB-dependent receptor [Rheinheimera baltica]MDP5150108.1 TonB-dependent receptor [Rheinheimera baltica]MDP5188303.1 TonB-dependent receptor [Rheinheimera baltica]